LIENFGSLGVLAVDPVRRRVRQTSDRLASFGDFIGADFSIRIAIIEWRNELKV